MKLMIKFIFSAFMLSTFPTIEVSAQANRVKPPTSTPAKPTKPTKPKPPKKPVKPSRPTQPVRETQPTQTTTPIRTGQATIAHQSTPNIVQTSPSQPTMPIQQPYPPITTPPSVNTSAQMIDVNEARKKFDNKEFMKAIELYNRASVETLDLYDIVNFATSNYFCGKFTDGLCVVEEGIKRFPRNAPLNRLGMYFNYELGNYEKAYLFGDKLFYESDNLKTSWMDYFYHGLAMQSARSDYDGAIAEFKTALGMDIPASNKLSLIQTLYSAYSAKGDFDNAIKYYNDYLTAKGNPTANDYNSLARMYTKHADEVPEAEKEQWLMKADATYGEAIAKFPANAEYLNILRARLNAGIDADMSRGLAKPYYEAAANILAAKADRSAAETTRLVECYRYLGWYYNEKADKATCQSYWRKVKELDPANTEADQFLQ